MKDGLFLENHSFKLSGKSLKLFLDFLNQYQAAALQQS